MTKNRSSRNSPGKQKRRLKIKEEGIVSSLPCPTNAGVAWSVTNNKNLYLVRKVSKMVLPCPILQTSAVI